MAAINTHPSGNCPWAFDPQNGLYLLSITVTDNRFFNGPYGGINMPSGADVFFVRVQGIQGGMLWKGQAVVIGGNSVGR